MSSSKGANVIMQATPWTLDELPMPDLFATTDVPSVSANEQADVDDHEDIAAEFTRREAEAYARGVEAGERAARAASDERMSAALSALGESIASLQLHTTRWTANTEENIAVIAIAVARHIVQREVTTDHTIVRDLVQRALEQFPIDQTITVRLHPDDAATCSSSAKAEGSGRLKDVRWLADPHIIRGGCLIEGHERIIDGRVDTSLERAYRSIGLVQA